MGKKIVSPTHCPSFSPKKHFCDIQNAENIQKQTTVRLILQVVDNTICSVLNTWMHQKYVEHDRYEHLHGDEILFVGIFFAVFEYKRFIIFRSIEY